MTADTNGLTTRDQNVRRVGVTTRDASQLVSHHTVRQRFPVTSAGTVLIRHGDKSTPPQHARRAEDFDEARRA